ncbi:DUF892 family protein, partial [Rhizobium leguminosarum]|uniref:DUF892 family protein n=1 Tax=Rhizobium leguminosarum TaxID=384 RepID=UPI003F99E07D
MAKEKTWEDLFYDTRKDIYFAERQILRALPKMARAAQSPELKKGFENLLQALDLAFGFLAVFFEA